MNKQVKRGLDWRGSVSFGVVLIVALALSWWRNNEIYAIVTI